MSTFILAVIIFGGAAVVIYSRLKKGKGCDCGECQGSCPVTKEHQK